MEHLRDQRLLDCPGCQIALPDEEGPVHPYMTASPACWARFGQVLAHEFENPAYFKWHQLTVDTYAVQHPGSYQDRRAIRSVGLHLATLYLVLEQDADPSQGPKLHRYLVDNLEFRWLDPPDFAERLKITHLLGSWSPEEYRSRVRDFAEDTWAAYQPHHQQVAAWCKTLD
jgi:hypothetical protein